MRPRASRTSSTSSSARIKAFAAPRALRHEEGRARGPGRRTPSSASDGRQASAAASRRSASSAATTSPSSPNNRVEWAVAAYACFGLGAAFVPMYEAQLAKEWEFIVSDCEAKVAHRRHRRDPREDARSSSTAIPSLEAHHRPRRGDEGATSRITYEALARGRRRRRSPAIKPEPKDIGVPHLHSGHDGNPKGVILTHGNIASNVSAMHDVFPIDGDDRSLSFLPWAHSFGQTCELHALFSMGASMAHRRGVDKILDNLAEVKPTLLFSVPRIFNKHLRRACRSRSRAKPDARPERSCKAALATPRKERDGRALSARRAARARSSPTARLLEGARALRRPAEVRVQRRRGDLARGRRVHRRPRHHRLRGLRPHRDEPDRDGELPRRAPDRLASASPSRA